mmetsp:Transcript_165622/g.531630  ORF Transcript_165622/g.531630 Transcript_165622/m.531630 type:complete len:1660 (+) Transcript_165622:188-5167(+)
MGNAHVARFDEPWVLLDPYNDLAYQDLLSSYKLFKVMKCRHEREELVLVKVFVLREGMPDLKELRRRVLEMKDIFRSHWLYPNVVPYQALEVGSQSAILLRPYFARNLYDRLHTRPFLSACEKSWIAFQVLCSVCQAHSVGIAHLDLKTENVFTSSWSHVILSDFALFKPLVLPRDDHGEFAFYFESYPPRSRCYLAPERFDAAADGLGTAGSASSSSSGSGQGAGFSQALAAMDVFSLGCVLAELFLDGQTLMDLPELRKYRSEHLDLQARLAGIKNPAVQAIIGSMLNRDPLKRKPASVYLREWCAAVAPRAFKGCLFPLSVVLLHPVYQLPDMRVTLLRHNFAGLLWSMVGAARIAVVLGLEGAGAAATWAAWMRRVERGVRGIDEASFHGMVNQAAQNATSRGEAPAAAADAASAGASTGAGAGAAQPPSGGGLVPRLAQPLLREGVCEAFSSSLFEHWESGCRQCLASGRVQSREAAASSIYVDFMRNLCGDAGAHALGAALEAPSEGAAGEDAEVVGILCNLICCSLQHVGNPRMRAMCLDMLTELSPFAPQFALLEQIVPYCHMLMTDPAAKVRARAVEVLTVVLGRVTSLPPSDMSLFPEYLFPQLLSSMIDMSGEPVVLLAVARNIGALARHAMRFAEVAVAAAHHTEAAPARGGDGGAANGGGLAEPGMPPLPMPPTPRQGSPGRNGAEGASHAASSSSAAVEVEAFDVQWKRIREAVQRVVKALLEYSPVRSPMMPGLEAEAGGGGAAGQEEALLTSAMCRDVKITLLRSMCTLADCFGRESTLNFLLPFLISFMNDPSWEVRAAFCEEAALLPKKVGQVSTEGIIWPCYEQALQDQEERVLQAALAGLAVLVRQRVLRRQSLETIASKVAPLLIHPSGIIRTRTLEVIAAIGQQLSAVDQFVFVLPKLRPFLRFELFGLEALEDALAQPLSRRALKCALHRRPSGEALHEAILNRTPFPAEAAVEEAGESGDITAADLAALELLRPYLHIMLRSRPSAAQISMAGIPGGVVFTDEQLTFVAGPALLHKLEYYAVNPHCASNRSLQALAESDDIGCPWPFAARQQQRLKHPLGLFSMQAFLAQALCLPPRPRDLGALNYLDGTPYSIYAASASRSDAAGREEAKLRADSAGDSFLSQSGSFMGAERHRSGAGQDLCDSIDPSLDLLSSSSRISASGGEGQRRSLDMSGLQGSDSSDALRGGSQRSAWHPQGLLLATLYEYAHQSGVPVVKVDATDDSRILVTGSKDGVVKIWNCGLLSCDMAVASSHTFTVPCTSTRRKQCLRALRTVRNSKALAVGSESGEMLLYRIDRGGQSATQVCKFATDNASAASAVMCIEQFDTDLESLVCFARQNGAVHGWDLRRDTPSWSVPKVPAWLGVPSCMSLGSDGHSMVVGTLGGGLLVYDLRFLAPWKQWRVASGAAALSMRTANFVSSPSVFVSLDSDCNEVALFDVVRGSCSTLFLTEPVVERQREAAVSVPTLLQAQPGLASAPPASPDALFAGAAAGGSRRAVGSVRSLWLPRGAQTFLLAGGADRKVRHWSLDPEHHTAEAFVVTPYDPMSQLDRARERTTYTSNHLGDVFVVQEQLAPAHGESPSRGGGGAPAGAAAAAEPAGPNPNHRDAILDMCTISLQSDILVTAGRDGLVKLWR